MSTRDLVLSGKLVKAARGLKGVKLKDFAEQVGINISTMYAIENESRTISDLNYIRLIEGISGLGISKQELALLNYMIEGEL